LLTAEIASAQTISLKLQEKHSVSMSGATAAFALDATCVDVFLDHDVLTLTGKRPCSTKVMVVSSDATKSLDIQVIPPKSSSDSAFRNAAQGLFSEGGSYSLRFQSGPAQFENGLEFARRSGDRIVRVRLVTTMTPSGLGNAGRLAINAMSYQLSSPRQELTLLDRAVEVSPLTVNGTTIRGFHLRRDSWFLHAGFTSLGSYQGLFFPTHRELVFGLGRQIRIGKHATITPSVFYFSGVKSASRAASPGPVGSLLYEYRPTSRLRILGELGIGRGVAAYFQGEFLGKSDDLSGRLRIAQGQFPALRANNRHGFYSDVRWTHRFSRSFRTVAYFSANRFVLPGFEQSNLIFNVQAQFQFARFWSVQGGWDYSTFTGLVPVSPTVRTASLPLSLGWHTRFFGGTLLYRFSRNSQNELGSHQLRESAYVRWRGFHLSVFHDRQTMAPTVDLILRQFPALEQALLQEGISATSPQQIATLLRERSELWNLGIIEGVNLFLSPMRTQYGANVNWTSQGRRRQQFQYTLLLNRSEGLRSVSVTTMHRASYTLQVSRANELFVSASWYQSSLDGGRSGSRPIVAFGFRHRFDSTPSFLLPGKKGMISGRVFVDKEMTGAAGPSSEPVPNAEVILDGTRSTRTDQHGRYWFRGVAQGTHSVEVNWKHDKPFYFTTASRVETDINSEVNFGISFAKARLFGRVLNDANEGVLGAVVRVKNQEFSKDTATGPDGSYHFSNLPEGQFEVTLLADSFPAGFRLEEITAHQVVLRAGTPASADFQLQALRSISGRVIVRSGAMGRPQPVAAVRVWIPELNRESTTDKDGYYLFRDLPAGPLSLVVEYQKRTILRSIVLPPRPVSLKSIDLDLTPTVPTLVSTHIAPTIPSRLARDGRMVEQALARIEKTA
jgi:hypothetical protein